MVIGVGQEEIYIDGFDRNVKAYDRKGTDDLIVPIGPFFPYQITIPTNLGSAEPNSEIDIQSCDFKIDGEASIITVVVSDKANIPIESAYLKVNNDYDYIGAFNIGNLSDEDTTNKEIVLIFHKSRIKDDSNTFTVYIVLKDGRTVRIPMVLLDDVLEV